MSCIGISPVGRCGAGPRKWSGFAGLGVVLVFAAVFGLPAEAWAFTPGTHLHFGLAILGGALPVAPAVLELIRRYRHEYLYGNIAADIVVGKNTAPYYRHCHNWQLIFEVAERPPDPGLRALMLGYLSHLAADTIAHNYFIPYKLLEAYSNRALKHLYWEVRLDTQLVKTDAFEALRDMPPARAEACNAFLREHLRDSSTLMPFAMSHGVFNQVVRVQRFARYKAAANGIAKRSKWPLRVEEANEVRSLALGQIQGLLNDGQAAECVAADPTGERNLTRAAALVQDLRGLVREGSLAEREAVRLAKLLRPRFRNAIHFKLVIPDLRSLAAG